MEMRTTLRTKKRDRQNFLALSDILNLSDIDVFFTTFH
jgi:hypothetical protein